MEKDAFLRQLALELRFYLPRADRVAVLQDYCEYFDSALDEGKNEAETCAQLGSAKELAREIRSSEPLPRFFTLRGAATWVMRTLENPLLGRALIGLPLLWGLFLWITARGWIFWQYLLSISPAGVGGIALADIGPAAVGNIFLLVWLFISLGTACLVWSSRNASLVRLFWLPFYLGGCMTLGGIYRLFHSLTELAALPQLLLRSMLPLAWGAAAAAVLFLALTWPRRGGTHHGRAV